MAKITKKIRIKEYDVLNNEFKITFQLAGFADHLKFVSTFTYPGQYGFDGNGELELTMLGFNAGDIEQIVEEIFNWVEKPRKSQDGLSHGYTMRSRFEVTDRLEQERRGKAEAERIIVAAPPLDWAMSALEEMEDEPQIVVGADVQAHKAAGRISGAVALFKPEGSDEFIKLGDVSSQTITYADGVTVTQFFDKDIAEVIDEELDKHKHPIRAMQAAAERISAMETAGLGEESAKFVVPEGFECEEPNYPADPLDKLLDDFEDAIVAGQRQTWGIDKVSDQDYRATQNEGQRAVRAICGYVDALRTPNPLPTEAIENAVTSIHKHVRRFMTPATPREHDFLRSIIQEEIEKVVGGVL
ncbi:hypothetical protein Kim5_CH02898 [Rhizobium sp. Kim5]|nr:hypothetical protein Kim5_CH02898 [Rhizobium sp. Kim5]